MLFEEIMFTALFDVVILYTKYEKTTPTSDPMLKALLIAATLNGLIGMVGPDTGGCLNPTIGLTIGTFQRVFNVDQELKYFKYMIVYLLGPLIGSTIAGLFTKYVYLRTHIPI